MFDDKMRTINKEGSGQSSRRGKQPDGNLMGPSRGIRSNKNELATCEYKNRGGNDVLENDLKNGESSFGGSQDMRKLIKIAWSLVLFFKQGAKPYFRVKNVFEM